VLQASDVSPWAVPCAAICDDFRPLQQSLTRLVLATPALAHRWGIAGPKRKAVLARLGLLRYLNHELDMYLPAVLHNTEAALAGHAAAAALADKATPADKKTAPPEDFFPVTTSVEALGAARDGDVPTTAAAAAAAAPGAAFMPHPGAAAGAAAGVVSAAVVGGGTDAVLSDGALVNGGLWDRDGASAAVSTAAGGGGSGGAGGSAGLGLPTLAALGHGAPQTIPVPVLSLSWAPLTPAKALSVGPGLLPASRYRIFPDFKMVHFWEVVARSAARPARTEDDYDYPEDLPQVPFWPLRLGTVSTPRVYTVKRFLLTPHLSLSPSLHR